MSKMQETWSPFGEMHNSPLHEYANRQWSGLLNDFYKPRWQQFFSMLQQSLQTGKTPDFKAFEKDISQWEWHWVNEHKSFPVEVSGNSIAVSLAMYKKYREVIAQSYP